MHLGTTSVITVVLICLTAMGRTSTSEVTEVTEATEALATANPTVWYEPVAEESVVGIHVPDMSWNWVIIAVAFVVVGGCCCFVCVSHTGHTIMNMFDPDGNCSTLMACVFPGCPCGQDTDNICVCSIS